MSGATTRALLQKDLPWLVLLLVGGVVGIVITLHASQFVHTFVVTPAHREELFHVAWSCGMALGVVAFAFDELLGTRELLAQRPIARRTVVAARLLGCAGVLAGWFVLGPFAAYVAYAFTDPSWQWGHSQQWPSILGAMVPAVSACTLGALATSLPFAWWSRLTLLGATWLLVCTFVFVIERGEAWDATSWPWFVGGHAAAAALAVGLLLRLDGGARDVDRPLPARARRWAVVPALAVGALGAGVLLPQVFAATAQQRLRLAYPRVLPQDGRYVLAVRDDWDVPWQIVDRDHRRIGEHALGGHQPLSRTGMGLDDDIVRVEAPRGASFSSSGLDFTRRQLGTLGRLLVDVDGTVWWEGLTRELRPLPKSAHEPRFAARTRVHALDDGGKKLRAVVLVEPPGDAVWRFDDANAAFVRLPVPSDDVVVGVGDVADGSSFEPLAETDGIAVAKDEDLVRGRNRFYALRGNRLVAAGLVKATAAGASRRLLVRDDDLLAHTVEVPAAAGMPAFAHRFAPRTGTERAFAALALACSAVRPPLLQCANVLGPDVDHTVRAPRPAAWRFGLCDPLVVVGGRWWLVAVSVALGALLAFLIARRMRRLGADAATVRFWALATLALGPVGALACVACERPRAYARRGLEVPSPAPRIASPLPDDLPEDLSEEVPA